MSWYRWADGALILRIHVQPKASNDAIVGLHCDALKIRITAPPVEGKANQHLTRFLAKSFKVKNGQVRQLSGETSREKTFEILEPLHIPALPEGLAIER